MSGDLLGKVVVAYVASDPERRPHFIGHAFSYSQHPTYTVTTEDGTAHAWVEPLCREATREEEREYWLRRCTIAEHRRPPNAAEPPSPSGLPDTGGLDHE